MVLLKKINSITYVGYRVTERCNKNCPFCFSKEKDQPADSSLPEIKNSLVKLKEAGATSIGVMGGEPLLREDIIDVMKLMKEMNFEVILSTNAILLKPLLNRLNGVVDWISISLDAADEENNDKYRGKGQFKKAIEIIELYDPNIHKFKLKINTVVHKENFNSIDGIGNIIGLKPIRWKLLQFTPRRLGKTSKNRFSISLRKFLSKVNQLKKVYPQTQICLRTYTKNEDYDLLIVRPNGELLVNKEEDYLNIGNINETDVKRQLEKINSLSENYYQENWNEFEESYR